MYILKVETLEVGYKVEQLKKRFKELKKRIETGTTCISTMNIIDTSTGEIIEKYDITEQGEDK